MSIARSTGFPVEAAGSPQTTITITPNAVGDLIVLGVEATGVAGLTVTAVTGGGVTTWTKAIDHLDATNSSIYSAIWYGVAASAGSAQTITITTSVSPTGGNQRLSADSFTSTGDTGNSWALDVSGVSDNQSLTVFDYPSLTPTKTSPEVYFGVGFANATYTSGSTTGFTYSYNAYYDGGHVYDAACAPGTAYAPTATLGTGGTIVQSVAAVFYRASPPAIPSTSFPVTAGASATQSPLTYVAYDLRSGAYLGALPLNGVTFGSQLMQTGSFTGTIDISSPAVQALGPISLSQPARTFIGVDYMGSLIWGGIVWPRAYKFDGATRVLTITASDLTSYFSQRVQATDYSSPPYSGITGTSVTMPIWNAASTSGYTWDSLLIAWQLISDALNVPNGNLLGGMGIAANGYTTPAAYLASGTGTPAGDYLSVNYPYSSLQGLSTMIQQLASNGLGVGFDYAIDVAYSAGPGSPVVATVNLSYPRRGRSYASYGLVLNCGAAIEYEPPEDGTQVGNVVYEQGSSGSLVVSENANPLNAGYPILEQIKSRSNITSANMLAILTTMGISDLAQISYPVVTPSVTMDLFNSSVPLGDFITGDDVRWLIPTYDQLGNTFDPRFPAGMDSEFRITGYSAQVADAGQSKLTFNLALPPVSLAVAPAI